MKREKLSVIAICGIAIVMLLSACQSRIPTPDSESVQTTIVEQSEVEETQNYGRPMTPSYRSEEEFLSAVREYTGEGTYGIDLRTFEGFYRFANLSGYKIGRVGVSEKQIALYYRLEIELEKREADAEYKFSNDYFLLSTDFLTTDFEEWEESFRQRKNYLVDFVDEKYLILRGGGSTCEVSWDEKGNTIVLYFPVGEEYGYPEMDVRDILKYCENLEYVVLQESSISTQDSEPVQTTIVEQSKVEETQNYDRPMTPSYQSEEEFLSAVREYTGEGTYGIDLRTFEGFYRFIDFPGYKIGRVGVGEKQIALYYRTEQEVEKRKMDEEYSYSNNYFLLCTFFFLLI